MIDLNQLDQVEQEVLRAFEVGEFRPVRAARQAKERYQQFANWTLTKPRSINIRVAERDLQRIKALAAQQGMPYQTFISALIHQHSTKRPLRSNRTPAK